MSVFAIRNEGSFPSSLRELKDAGLFRVIPKDPYGYEYVISVRGSDVYVGTYRNGTVEIKIGAKQ